MNALEKYAAKRILVESLKKEAGLRSGIMRGIRSMGNFFGGTPTRKAMAGVGTVGVAGTGGVAALNKPKAPIPAAPAAPATASPYNIKMEKGQGYNWLAKQLNAKSGTAITAAQLKKRMGGQMLYANKGYTFNPANLGGTGALTGGLAGKQLARAKATGWGKAFKGRTQPAQAPIKPLIKSPAKKMPPAPPAPPGPPGVELSRKIDDWKKPVVARRPVGAPLTFKGPKKDWQTGAQYGSPSPAV